MTTRKTIAQAVLLAAALCSAATASATDTLARIRETRSITLAHREASVPFSYLVDDKNGNRQAVGYAVDVCLKLVDAVKKELKLPQLKINYLLVTGSTRIPVIAEGKADLECGSTTNNAERRKQVAFTIPHFYAATRMLVRVDSGIKNWTDLRGKKVVTTKGTTTIKLLNDRDKVRALGLKLVEGNDHNNSFHMVETFEADAFPMDDVLLYGLRANAKEPEKYAVIGEPLSTEPYAIMLNKDDTAFKAFIDKELARLMTDGDVSKLYQKWFKNPVSPKGATLNMEMGVLLRDTLRFPSDKVAD